MLVKETYFLWILVYGMVFLSSVPIYYALRIFRLTGWIRYWSPAWIVFISAMVLVLVRRILFALAFVPDGGMSFFTVYDRIISPAVTSIIFSVFIYLKHRFFSHWIKDEVLRRNGEK